MMEAKEMWDVKFLNWAEFTHAMMTQIGPTWDMLTDTHLLIGGINFTNAFLCV
jgi:hypothetical protein